MSSPAVVKLPAQERGHHRYSPSSLQAREASICYKPSGVETEASRSGTMCHHAHEQRDLTGLDDAQAEAVRKTIAFEDDIIKQYPGCKVLREVYLPIDDQNTTAGYADTIIISKDLTHAEIIDQKYGQWEVEPAETNVQGHCYLLGAFRLFPTLQTAGVSFSCPNVAIRESDGSITLGYVDRHVFRREQFQELYLRAKTIVARCREWDAKYEKACADQKTVYPTGLEYFPTHGTCVFCSRIGKCDGVRALACKTSKKFPKILVPEQLDALLYDDPRKAGPLIQLADLMKVWSEAVRKEITNLSINVGVAPDGFVLKTSSQPSIKDSNAVLQTAKQLGVPEPVLNEATSVTLGPLEKAINDAAPRGTKKKAVEAFRDTLEKAGAVVQGTPFAFLQRQKEKPSEE